jgi:hypothetical protein
MASLILKDIPASRKWDLLMTKDIPASLRHFFVERIILSPQTGFGHQRKTLKPTSEPLYNPSILYTISINRLSRKIDDAFSRVFPRLLPRNWSHLDG